MRPRQRQTRGKLQQWADSGPLGLEPRSCLDQGTPGVTWHCLGFFPGGSDLVDVATLLGLEPSSVLGSRLPLLRQLSHKEAALNSPHRQPTRGHTAPGGALRVLHFLKLGVGDFPNAHHDRWLQELLIAAKVGGQD